MSSHFIEKNVATIKNANETSEGRAKNINKGGSKVTNLHRHFSAENLSRRKYLSVVPFMTGCAPSPFQRSLMRSRRDKGSRFSRLIQFSLWYRREKEEASFENSCNKIMAANVEVDRIGEDYSDEESEGNILIFQHI